MNDLPVSSPESPPPPDNYEGLLASLKERFAAVLGKEKGSRALFQTRAEGLFQVFLDAVPASLRQINTCATCRRFLERYGNIVAVEADGGAVSAIWDPATAPEPYTGAVRALAAAVVKAPIGNVFLAEESTWGVPKAGEWDHFAVTPPEGLVFKPSAVMTRWQTVAEKRQDFETLSRGLEEFPLPIVRKAQALVSTETLYRSEKVLGVADWLLDLHEKRDAVKGSRAKENVTWLAVARAPAGFCHVKATMIGTLLEDLKAGLPFDQIKARFDAKMHPLQYQRATAEPTAGNIAQAEKIIEKLKTAGALERRFAKLADVQALWRPAASRDEDSSAKKGVFSHLLPGKKDKTPDVEIPPVTMTWDKFSKTVLPKAESIDFFVPADKRSYMGLVTAKNADAPPIIQWDSEERRNPVTWYFYANNTEAARWNLKAGVYHPVTAVVLQPSLWNAAKSFSHQGEKVFFLLKDARDLEYKSGCGFFTEFLKSEYHPIRSTMEAYVKSAVVSGKDEAEGCGIGASKGGAWDLTFRVASKGGVRAVYKLDRWD